MIQGSQEWIDVRLGRVTASRIADVMARIKSGWGASRANYMAEIVCERMTGACQDGYTNGAMQRGIELEPEARDAYSFYSGNDVETVGFLEHPTIPMTGASPDGHVASDGSVEIKCPQTNTHIETLLSGDVIAQKYILQIQWQLACSGRQWCDFVSYDPRMPEELKLFVRRINRDETKIMEIEDAVRQFLVEVEEKIAQLTQLQDKTPLTVSLERSLAAVTVS